MDQQIKITVSEQSLEFSCSEHFTISFNRDQEAAQAKPYLTPCPTLPAEIGAELQGGIYVGPMVENGRLVHLIAAEESIGKVKWEQAKELASDYEGGDYSDWYLPNKDELAIALAHSKSKFESGWHWTSTPYGSSVAWAVGFEYGDVYHWGRGNEFLVRPFRRLSI